MRRSARVLATLGLVLLLPGSGCHEEDEPPWAVLELGTRASFRDVFFLDGQHGWIVGGGHAIDGGLVGETRDGGATWTYRSGIVPHPSSRLFYLHAIHFFDERVGLIASDGGQILRTVDGGEHWHRVFKDGRRAFTAFSFIDPLEGWAVGDGLVAHTADAGASWQRVNEHGGENDGFRARDVHFVDAKHGLLVADHGRVHRTGDGGTTWSRVEVPVAPHAPRLWALHIVDDAFGWIVGDDGTILHTTDGGATWAPQASGTRFDLRDVHFVDARTGFAVGASGETGTSIVLHTTDGGVRWSVQQTVTGESLFALGFVGDRLGHAIGERVRREPQKLLRYEPRLEADASR